MYYVLGKPSISRPTQTRALQQSTTIPLRKREKSKRKRQTLVWSPEEEVWHEPYMVCLHKEFSEASIRCDSALELPWRDIALPLSGMRIRTEIERRETEETADNDEERGENEEVEKKESDGRMELPWKDLLIADVVEPIRAPGIVACDSAVEIPWSQLTLDTPPAIKPLPLEKTCVGDDIEIPWDDIMIPRNIIIAGKPRKHPSNITRRRPGGPGASEKCDPCNRCPKEKRSIRKLPVIRCPGPKK